MAINYWVTSDLAYSEHIVFFYNDRFYDYGV